MSPNVLRLRREQLKSTPNNDLNRRQRESMQAAHIDTQEARRSIWTPDRNLLSSNRAPCVPSEGWWHRSIEPKARCRLLSAPSRKPVTCTQISAATTA